MSKSGIWVYEYDRRYPCKYDITEVRYVLGEIFDTSIPKALICIGINPSTAIPEDLDPTLLRIQRYAQRVKVNDKNLYGAWYMLNVYPQRSTDPKGMDENKKQREEIHKRNLDEIEVLLNSLKGGADIWCAWGTNINEREYLVGYLRDILDLVERVNENKVKNKKDVVELKSHVLTSEGHPAHPLASIKDPNQTAEELPKGAVANKLKLLSECKYVDPKGKNPTRGINEMYRIKCSANSDK